ncbi:hypothetical protein P7H47_04590 [Enterococcus cecorum]|uniref:Uncharacterized protein n=1 Tax=Enterococcus cecorum TaxID=44008 RepID=A0AAW8TM56_9ENTE|nr:hypothetical protein [Enterococcus cecorum]MDT2796526.1 hypothetical protein [Enterococcus cecorum]
MEFYATKREQSPKQYIDLDGSIASIKESFKLISIDEKTERGKDKNNPDSYS